MKNVEDSGFYYNQGDLFRHYYAFTYSYAQEAFIKHVQCAKYLGAETPKIK